MICSENAANLAGCCMFPEYVIVSLVVRFIVVVLLDPFVVQWWLFTDLRKIEIDRTA